MASKKRKYRQKWEFDDFDDLDFESDDGIDLSDIAMDFYSADSRYEKEKDRSISAQRKIERRMDMWKLQSELDDWEIYGEQDDDWR